MAAPMRSLFFHAQKTVPRICWSRSPFNATCRSTTRIIPVTPPLTTQAKLYHINSPALRTALYSLARSAADAGPPSQTRAFSLLTGSCNVGTYNTGLLQRLSLAQGASLPQLHQPSRTVIRFSRNKGKKKSVSAVTARFYRFSNGLWLRTIAGRNKKRWKKSPARKRRTKWHVFCSKSQSKKLDLMVTKGWKERRYYPDDPLEPFQERNYKGLNFYPGVKIMHRRKDL